MLFHVSSSLLAFFFHTDLLHAQQCSKSATWDTVNGQPCTYTDCTCPNSTTQICTTHEVPEASQSQQYSENDYNNMELFLYLCDNLRYAGCTNPSDLFWIQWGPNEMERCSQQNEECPLYCKCDESDADAANHTYYVDVTVYDKKCIECQCRTRGAFQEYYRECNVIDTIAVGDDHWDSWTCPEVEEEVTYLTCANNANGQVKTCSNWNDTSCVVESSFEPDIGTLDWQFGENIGSFFQVQSSTSYGCESDLMESYLCEAFDAHESTSCANIEFQAYNAKDCNDYQITGYNITYKHELACYNGDLSNYNISDDGDTCVTDDTMSRFYTTLLSCRASNLAVSSTFGRRDYCPSDSFFTSYERCEYLASQATFEYGCLCEAYAILYNSDRLDSSVLYEIERMFEAYQEEIEFTYESDGYCCDIDFTCDLSVNDGKTASKVEYNNYIVNFEVRVNDTNAKNFDEEELKLGIADEAGLEMGEIEVDMDNVEYKTFVKVTHQNGTSSVYETIEWAIVPINLKIGCASAAAHFITSLDSYSFSFGLFVSVDSVTPEFTSEQYEYSPTSGVVLIDVETQTVEMVDEDSSEEEEEDASSNNKNDDVEELDGGIIAAIVVSLIVFLCSGAFIYWYVNAGGKEFIEQFWASRAKEEEKKKNASAEIRAAVVVNYGGASRSQTPKSSNNSNMNRNGSQVNSGSSVGSVKMPDLNGMQSSGLSLEQVEHMNKMNNQMNNQMNGNHGNGGHQKQVKQKKKISLEMLMAGVVGHGNRNGGRGGGSRAPELVAQDSRDVGESQSSDKRGKPPPPPRVDV